MAEMFRAPHVELVDQRVISDSDTTFPNKRLHPVHYKYIDSEHTTTTIMNLKGQSFCGRDRGASSRTVADMNPSKMSLRLC